MSYEVERGIGDEVLYALARQAGAKSDFTLLSVKHRYKDHSGDDGVYAFELWTEFETQCDWTGDVEIHRFDGPLESAKRKLFEATTTVPVKVV